MYGIFNIIIALSLCLCLAIFFFTVFSLFITDWRRKVYQRLFIVSGVFLLISLTAIALRPANKYAETEQLENSTFVVETVVGEVYDVDGNFYARIPDPAQDQDDAFHNGTRYIYTEVEKIFVFNTLNSIENPTELQKSYGYELAVDLGYLHTTQDVNK